MWSRLSDLFDRYPAVLAILFVVGLAIVWVLLGITSVILNHLAIFMIFWLACPILLSPKILRGVSAYFSNQAMVRLIFGVRTLSGFLSFFWFSNEDKFEDWLFPVLFPGAFATRYPETTDAGQEITGHTVHGVTWLQSVGISVLEWLILGALVLVPLLGYALSERTVQAFKRRIEARSRA